jgi:hypothetical protein
MSERTPLSKKLRFDVFKRDGFCCQYCGAHPSETVVLEVDHVIPVAEGGKNDIDNLVTACFDCNRGKGAGLLSSVPESLAEKANIAAEREAQIRGYYEILEAIKQRRDDELWSIADIFMERYADESILRTRLASIQAFLERLSYYEVQEAMEIATRKMYNKGPAFSYFCGICWRKIKRANGEEE